MKQPRPGLHPERPAHDLKVEILDPTLKEQSQELMDATNAPAVRKLT